MTTTTPSPTVSTLTSVRSLGSTTRSATTGKVSASTAILPAGWRDRIVLLENDLTAPGRGLCLDRHDLVVSKLVAGREKGFGFAWALIEAGLVDTEVLVERAEMLETVPAVQRRVRRWIDSCVNQVAARRDSDY